MPQLELTSKERSQLKSAAHALKPLVQIGDKGLTPAVLKEINVHLTAHQLIKVKMSGDDREYRLQALHEICDSLSCAAVQHVGKTFILYRPDLETLKEDEFSANKDKEPFIPKKKAADLAENPEKAVKAKKKPSSRPRKADSDQPRSHNIPRKGSALSLKSRRQAPKKKN